jgi:RNA ligase (TIGR02306 family)
MSKHEVLVVEVVEVKEHPNADALEVVKISGYDYTIVTKKGEFKVGDLGVFVEPDYMVPTDHEKFNFLKTAKKNFIALQHESYVVFGFII